MLIGFQQCLSVIKDVVQTGFFVTAGIVTVLTYLKAKRTLLQPVRTEVFKEQIKVFAEMLGFFIGKGEVALRNDFGLTELFDANIIKLFDDYARHFFDVEIDTDQRPYNMIDCPVVMISLKTAEKYIRPNDGYVEEPKVSRDRVIHDPRTKAATWAKYEFGAVSVPKKFTERQSELERFMDSPLVPNELVKLLKKFTEAVGKNVGLWI